VAGFLDALPDRDALTAAMATANLAWGDVRSGAEVLASPTLRARGAIRDVDDRGGGHRRVVDSPYRFSGADSGVRGAAARRGEHNAEVLADWLDLDEAAIRTLEDAGVLVAEGS
jgi:crotonobetainyl-CoA:carnitine CoA-transferase CaiB-like acyl-CoA transferase